MQLVRTNKIMQPLGTQPVRTKKKSHNPSRQKKSQNPLGQNNHATSWDKILPNIPGKRNHEVSWDIK